MATSTDKPEVASDSDEGLTHVLEQTIHAKVLKDLGEPLAEILHAAVREGIVAASKNASPRVPQMMAPKVETKTKAVSRPAAGGRCAKVWSELDKLVGKGKTPTLQDVTKLAQKKGMNGNTARIQFYRWRSATQAQPSA